ncbi:MAG: DNA mismatch repair endonuclease MutL [Bacillota bacterium]
MARIHLLDEATISRIAAGEIIDRPASVVKELVENSIDAGSGNIEIEIKNGGRQLIRVTDDGCGMTRDEALLALERHATSKIKTIDDLSTLKSLGFRGEALPSIAAVSRMEIYTKPKRNKQGTYLEINGGRIEKVKPAGCKDGTSIYIHDLFSNVPARLKYLKSIPTEAGLIADILGKIVLAYPDIAFRLLHHNYTVLQTAGGDPYQNIAAVFGKDTAKEMIAFSWEGEKINIHGWLGKPSIAKSSRQYEILFVNKRLIKNRIISSALEKAFHTLLPISRYPFAIVFLEVGGEKIDVNVHPSKQEIRFSNEGDVFRLIYHAVNGTLRQHNLIPNWQLQDEKEPIDPKSAANCQYKMDPLPQLAPPAAANVYASGDYTPLLETTLALRESRDVPRFSTANIHILPCVLCGVYIIAEDEHGLIFFDLHAAHERIIYEKFMQNKFDDHRQIFLIPENIPLTYPQMKAVQNLLPIFKDMGFELEEFGPGTLLLRSVPGNFAGDNPQEVLGDLIDLFLSLEQFQNPHELKEKFWTRLACRKALKAGDKMKPQEIEALIVELYTCENPFTCPHGRPTMVRIETGELEKKFIRRK